MYIYMIIEKYKYNFNSFLLIHLSYSISKYYKSVTVYH